MCRRVWKRREINREVNSSFLPLNFFSKSYFNTKQHFPCTINSEPRGIIIGCCAELFEDYAEQVCGIWRKWNNWPPLTHLSGRRHSQTEWSALSRSFPMQYPGLAFHSKQEGAFLTEILEPYWRLFLDWKGGTSLFTIEWRSLSPPGFSDWRPLGPSRAVCSFPIVFMRSLAKSSAREPFSFQWRSCPELWTILQYSATISTVKKHWGLAVHLQIAKAELEDM